MLLPVLALGNLADLLILVSCLKETARKHQLLSSHFLGSCCGPCGGPWRGLGRGEIGKGCINNLCHKDRLVNATQAAVGQVWCPVCRQALLTSSVAALNKV